MAGVAVVLAALTSIDFGVYVALVAVIAALLMQQRKAALIALIAAAAGAAVITAIALAVDGILGDFIRTSFFELPAVAPAYSLGLFTMPAGLKTYHFPPEVLIAIFDKSSFVHVLWFVVLTATAAAAIPVRTSARRRAAFNALRVLAAFVLVCTISYAELHHLYWQYALAPLICAAIFRLFHSVNGIAHAAAPILVVIAVMIGQPTIHIGIAASLRNSHGPMEPTLREVALPRAHGAYFSAANAAIVEATGRYVAAHLNPEETFFDFTNHGLLYFLVNRDCPIRQFEVGFYEPELAQRDVIARLERNPRVQAALIPLSPERDSIEGVPNAVRAPLVWAYLQQHFEPDTNDGGVAFWRRK